MTPVTLSPLEIAYGCDLGKWRYVRAVAAGRQNRLSDIAGDGISAHINGALGELAAARRLGLPLPSSIDTFHSVPDLPPDVEIRWRSRHDWALIVRDDDDRTRRFVLVTGSAPTLDVRGWIYGTEMVPEWRANHGGYEEAWFVPADALHDLATFDHAVPA